MPFCLALISIIGFSSCINTRKTPYFYNLSDSLLNNPRITEPTFKKNDILSISVSSANAEASAMYNVANSSSAGVQTTNASLSQSVGYLINEDGYIQFPAFGLIKAEGLTRKQLTNEITKMFVDQKLLKDPIISIRQLNYHVTVLGEVEHPMVVNVSSERINILEALGFAGDLTIYARRDNVLLIREENGHKLVKRFDLNDKSILYSPYYNLISNDVIYVEPSKSKIRSASEGRQILPIVLSALSIVAIIATRTKY